MLHELARKHPMRFKQELVEFRVMPSDKKTWCVVGLYKDGAHEVSCAMAVLRECTWGRIIEEYLPVIVREIKERIDRIMEDSTNGSLNSKTA